MVSDPKIYNPKIVDSDVGYEEGDDKEVFDGKEVEGKNSYSKTRFVNLNIGSLGKPLQSHDLCYKGTIVTSEFVLSRF